VDPAGRGALPHVQSELLLDGFSDDRVYLSGHDAFGEMWQLAVGRLRASVG